MKKIITIFLISFSFSVLAQESSLDDSISENLAPLLSNYLRDYQARFEAVHVLPLSPGQSSTKPVFLLPVTSFNAASLQDCEENASSLVCQTAKAINAYVATYVVTKGKINLNITIFQNAKVVKEFKDIELLRF
jgi:hypothetical protein